MRGVSKDKHDGRGVYWLRRSRGGRGQKKREDLFDRHNAVWI